MGSMSRTTSMAATWKWSRRSRSQRRRAFSNSARARRRRSCSSAFSAANCSRSAAMAVSWPSRIESNGPPSASASGTLSWGFSVSTAFSIRFLSHRFQILKFGTFQRPAGLQHGGDYTLIVHAHGAQHGYFYGHSAGHTDGHPNEREVFHRRVGLLQPDPHRQLARRLFQEAVEQFHEALFFFQGMEKLAHSLACQVQVQPQQVAGALHVDVGRGVQIQQALLRQHLQLVHRRVIQLAFIFDAAEQLAAGLTELPAAEVTIHVIADGGQFLRGGGLLQHDDAVAHHVVSGDQHHQYPAVGKRDKLDLVEFLGQFRNGGGDAHVARQFHQDVGGALHALADRIQGTEFVRHAVRFGGGHTPRGERTHKETESLLSGHPAGGSVRLGEVALIGEVRHHIADGGRTERIVAALRNGARSHRFPGVDICPDNRSQNVPIPETKRRVRSHRPLSINTALHTSVVWCRATGQMTPNGWDRCFAFSFGELDASVVAAGRSCYMRGSVLMYACHCLSRLASWAWCFSATSMSFSIWLSCATTVPARESRMLVMRWSCSSVLMGGASPILIVVYQGAGGTSVWRAAGPG